MVLQVYLSPDEILIHLFFIQATGLCFTLPWSLL